MSETIRDRARANRPAGWWRTATVYQVYPRSFCDFDGDGVGDIPGITARLDHLQALGVDAIWLSPVYRSPMDDNGYDISDYTDVDPTFGTLADLDELIDGLHERGMKLLMDLVVNHTSDEHPWFEESREPDSPKRDWYWWRPGRDGDVAEPTNWEAAFSGPAWHRDERSGDYYLHLFSRRQPDLNWENPDVRGAVHAMMRWWVDRGVDGFRMDVINFISKTLPLTDGALAPGRALSPAFAHVADGPRMHEFLAEIHREVMAGENLITVGEMPGVSVAEAQRYTAPERGEIDMVFQFEHVDLDVRPGGTKWDLRPLELPALKENLARWQDGLAERGWNSLYWNNHDQPRIVSRWGDDCDAHRVRSAKTLGTVLHLHRGTPYVYQGEELGMTNAGFDDIDRYRDIESVNHHAEALGLGRDEAEILAELRVKSRDNARTPMQWDASSGAGFTRGTPWIDVNPNHASINAEAARRDPDSVFHHYRRLIALRKQSDVVVDGRFALQLADHPQLWVFTRTLEDQTVTVVANCSSTEVAWPTQVGDLAGRRVLISTEVAAEEAFTPPAVLGPWESWVVQ